MSSEPEILNMQEIRNSLQDMNYKAVFNYLGWNRPTNPTPRYIERAKGPYTQEEIAQLGRVPVFEIITASGKIPKEKECEDIHKEIAQAQSENLLIFLDNERTQSYWYWVKRENGKKIPRNHLYLKGQPGDLSLSKLEALAVDMQEFDDTGDISVITAVEKLHKALDVEKVTKRFYNEYQAQHKKFMKSIRGIDDEHDQRWYASVILNRLMFIYFMQRKGFIDEKNQKRLLYLQTKLAESRKRGNDLYYSTFLNTLFFEGFAKEERSRETEKLLGNIKYLNGGLFLKHPIEKRWTAIHIPDEAFDGVFDLLGGYTWNLDDTPGGKDDEISPHVLGYIFEKFINQKSFGAYYTRPQITDYLCTRTIHKLVLEKINALFLPGGSKHYDFETVDELLMNLNVTLCNELLDTVLPSISLLDPACGSGAFLVSALNVLVTIYSGVIGWIDFSRDHRLESWKKQIGEKHPSLLYYVKKKIITDNLFGVDIMEEAIEIARLRLFLALVASVKTVDQLEPLPNIDFNVLSGNSLIGLLAIKEDDYNKVEQMDLFHKSFKETVEEKGELIRQYKAASGNTEKSQKYRDEIQQKRGDELANLNQLLLTEFSMLKVKFEEATWDDNTDRDGKTKKRAPRIADIAALQPFHWGYEFYEVMMKGGFDIIITNPPWETLKPQAKEFFAEHSELVTKNKMHIEDFEELRKELLVEPEILTKWLKYQNKFPIQSAFFRVTPQYHNQISIVNEKKAGTDINFYKLFTEQCYNLLRAGGVCGMVIHGGICTEKGAKQLREMLFKQTQILGLFGFENHGIFENVDDRFKFTVLTFEKGGKTQAFPTAFMRHDINELERFPKYGSLQMDVDLISRFSPDSLSIMEFKDDLDSKIIEKMQKFPRLGATLEGTWNLHLRREFDMTNDSDLFRTVPQSDQQPLYEGKMMHQFSHTLREPHYWIDTVGENKLRNKEIGRLEKAFNSLPAFQKFKSNASTQKKRVSSFLKTLGISPITDSDTYIDADVPRLVYRSIARNTDNRTLISTVLPANVFTGNSLNYIACWKFCPERILNQPTSIKQCYEPAFSSLTLAYLCGILNSFVLDYALRSTVSANINNFFIMQLPVPRLAEQDAYFRIIARSSAQLICTTAAFQSLWNDVFPDKQWSLDEVAIHEDERAVLRAKIDGVVAHLYDLSEEEFVHVLSTFPLVDATIKSAALDAYRSFSSGPNDRRAANLIDEGETRTTEFKVAACWNARTRRKDDAMKENIIEEVAAFLNSPDGGTLIIGVEDDGTIVGLVEDYNTANPQKKNQDGYMLFLRDILRNGLVRDCSLYYNIVFARYKNCEVCLVDVKPAPWPVFKNGGDFYIRELNGKRKLTSQHALDYQQERWK